MAHTTGDEFDYFIQDERGIGQIIKVIHHNDVKKETNINSTSAIVATNSYGQHTMYHHQQQQQQQNNHLDVKKEPTASSSKYYEHQMQNSINDQQQCAHRLIQNNISVRSEGGNTSYTILSPQTINTIGGRQNNSNNSSSSSSNGNNSNCTIVKYESGGIHSTRSNTKQESNINEKPHRYTNHNVVVQTTTTNNSSNKLKPNTSTQHTVQTTIRRRKTDKVGKGLRHFSMKVCKKVKEKGSTTYNEVADELVAEEVQSQTYDSANCDQKNIRRRVYDALNVLMAMNIISKDKKEIRWIGLPTNSVQECNNLEKENQERKERIEAKLQQLKELLVQHISFKHLTNRNQENQKQGIIPAQNSFIDLPFIIVNTHKSTKINCSVSTDKSEYYFKFSDKFEIHDDIEVLQRMGLSLGFDNGECSYENIQKAKSLVSKNFENYIEYFGQNTEAKMETDDCDSLYTDTIDQSSDSRTVDRSSLKDDLDEQDHFSDNSEVD